MLSVIRSKAFPSTVAAAVTVPLPPLVLFRIGRRNSTGRDRRPLYAANLRWQGNPYRTLTAKAVRDHGATHGAAWKCLRPKVTAQYAIGGDVLPDPDLPPREQPRPYGAISAAALLCGAVNGAVNILAYQVEIATPAQLFVGYDDREAPVFETVAAGHTLYFVAVIRNGLVEPADPTTQDDGGDLIVSEEHARLLVDQHRAANPDALIYCSSALASVSTDQTEALERLFERSKGKGALLVSLGSGIGITSHPVFKPGAVALGVFGAVWIGYSILQNIDVMSVFIAPEPPRPYEPPPLASSFLHPLPGVWVEGCLNTLDNLVRPIPGYDLVSVACLMPDAPAKAGIAAPPASSITGMATANYSPRENDRGRLMEVREMYLAPADRAAGVTLSISDGEDDVQVSKAIALPSRSGGRAGASPDRGVHALMRAADMRAWLLDRRELLCLDIKVSSLANQRGALLSSPGRPLAVTNIWDFNVSISSAMPPDELGAYFNDVPGFFIVSLTRSFMDKGSSAATAKPGFVRPATPATKALGITDAVGCDHPLATELGQWKMEAVTNVFPR